MAHEFAGALQEMCGVGQGCAVKEADVDVRMEGVDIGEGGVAEAGNGAAVMQEFADFVAAFPQGFKPVAGEGSEFGGMLFHPRVDGGVMQGGAVETQ